MRTRVPATAFVAVLVLLVAIPAQAADFSPSASLALSLKRVNANPTLTVNVHQDHGEEKLSKVAITVPHGFRIPPDAAIADGEKLGAGTISVALAPACTTQADINVNIVERNRTAAEKNAGVVAVWVVDLKPVTTIDLKWKGNVANGWTATGAIPQNDAYCPPFDFKATIAKSSATSHVKLVRNPSSAGAYTFKIAFTGVGGDHASKQQVVHITA
jgi:hypothetical protein